MTSQRDWESSGLARALPRGLGDGTLPSQIHDSLKTAILRGDVEPGTRLQPGRLAAHFGVSHIPVREALSALQGAGWVEMRPHHGAFVRERSETDMRELFELRVALEGQVARLAALRRTPSESAGLQTVVEQIEDGVRDADGERVLEHCATFYASLRAAARNSVITPIAEDLEKRAQFYFSRDLASLMGERWLASHEQMASAVAARDADAAERVARSHVEQTTRAVAEALGYDLLPKTL